jgi:N-acetylneuraminate synthase
MKNINLGEYELSTDLSPYIIAEIGVNHEGSIEKAIELIDLAEEGGANAVKFQAYKAELLTSVDSPAYWDKSVEPIQNQYDLYKKTDSFGKREFEYLHNYCKKKRVDFVCTPFDLDAVDFLDSLMPYFKIASSDITNTPLLRKIASKNKPVILSTGAATLAEIDLAVHELEQHGAIEIILLHCIINYPTKIDNANLNMIQGLTKVFPTCGIGYSDHTTPDQEMTTLTTAYLKGATVIEKHFTDDKALHGNDHFHAMDVNDLKKFVKNIDIIQRLSGSYHKAPLPSEGISRLNARRSIVLSKNIKAGHVLSENDLISKRPAFGISPIHLDNIVGKVVRLSLEKNHILKWSDLAE